jgi:hypothetical protein
LHSSATSTLAPLSGNEGFSSFSSFYVSPCKTIASEVNLSLEEDSLDPGHGIVQIPTCNGTIDKNKGQPLPMKNQGREKVSVWIDDFESKNNCTDELSVVLDLDEGSLANDCKIASFVWKDGKFVLQSSIPCSVIGSKKIPDVSCEDPQLVVVITKLDE